MKYCKISTGIKGYCKNNKWMVEQGEVSCLVFAPYIEGGNPILCTKKICIDPNDRYE